MTTRIRAAILDVDGTLVDSNDAHARAWVDAFREFGYDVPYDKVRPLIGMGGDNLLPEAIRLEKAFGGGAETWLRMQAAYDLAQAEKHAARIKVRRVKGSLVPA